MSRCSQRQYRQCFVDRSQRHFKGAEILVDACDHPGDVFHLNFLTGHPAYFDITVHNSFQPKFVSSSATVAGAVSLAREIEKGT